MPLGLNIISTVLGPRNDCVRPVSVFSYWQGVVDAGGPAVQDAATITNPETQITASTRHKFVVDSRGTLLVARLGYDDALTTITSPVVKVFGRTGTDVWTLLKTKAGTLTATLTAVPATDVTDGTLNYTTPDITASTWDCLGCEEILLGVETALAGTGVVNNSIIQFKLM